VRCATFVTVGLCPATAAAESAGDGALSVFGGVGVTRADLRFRAPTARVETRVDALPTVTVGVAAWPESAIGLHLDLELGTGAALTVPGTTQTLRYTAHRLDVGGIYRWTLDPGGSGLDVGLGLGLQGVVQRVQAQTPALLVDSQVAGPALSARVDKYFRSRRLVTALSLDAGLPFFVRESPRDSGDPGRFWAWGAQARLAYQPSAHWCVALDVGTYEQHLSFRGEGTRATGVESGEAVDRFDTVRVTLHWQR
jgi:hypothetical protein